MKRSTSQTAACEQLVGLTVLPQDNPRDFHRTFHALESTEIRERSQPRSQEDVLMTLVSMQTHV
jgi:hypothetical protein